MSPGHSQEPPQRGSSSKQTFQAYLSKHEVEAMVRLQSGKLSPARVESLRHQACTFIDKTGQRLGFPRRTVATAHLLYHRFHLYFPIPSFNFFDVSLSTLLLASKLEDTLKKSRELLLVGWYVKQIMEGQPHVGNEPSEQMFEIERVKLIGVERLLLECICFDFGSGSQSNNATCQDVLSFIVQFSKVLNVDKQQCKLAFRIGIDSQWTLVGLLHPPHQIALASLYLTSFFSDHQYFSQVGWESDFRVDIEDIEDIVHYILDFFISLSSPTSHPLTTSHALEFLISTTTTSVSSSDLTKLKIKLRSLSQDRTQSPRKRVKTTTATSIDSKSLTRVLGRDDTTVRFGFANSNK